MLRRGFFGSLAAFLGLGSISAPSVVEPARVSPATAPRFVKLKAWKDYEFAPAPRGLEPVEIVLNVAFIHAIVPEVPFIDSRTEPSTLIPGTGRICTSKANYLVKSADALALIDLLAGGDHASIPSRDLT
jgi:hypothetical protein